MRFHDRVEHHIVRHLIGACLDHDHLFLGACHGELEIGDLPLLLGGVHHGFPVHKTHEHARDRTVPGDVRNGQGDGRADHGGDLRAAIVVHAHHQKVQRHVVAQILREKRTDGTVDDTCGKDRLFRGSALSAQISAGDPSHGVELFVKIYRQRQKIDAVPRLCGCGGGAENGCFAVLHERRAVGKARHFAGLYPQGSPRQLCFKYSSFAEFQLFAIGSMFFLFTLRILSVTVRIFLFLRRTAESFRLLLCESRDVARFLIFIYRKV